MIAYVSRNVDGHPSITGPFIAEQNEFMSKHGIPVFFSESQLEFAEMKGFEVEQAAPGMVGLGFHDLLLYVVLKDGHVSALPLQVINIVNEYPHRPRRTSEQAKQLRSEEQPEPAL